MVVTRLINSYRRASSIEFVSGGLVLLANAEVFVRVLDDVNRRLRGDFLALARQNIHGRIEKGFDFLGYQFSPQGLTLARQTIWSVLYGFMSKSPATRWLPFGLECTFGGGSDGRVQV